MSHRPHMSRPYMSHHVTNPVPLLKRKTVEQSSKIKSTELYR